MNGFAPSASPSTGFALFETPIGRCAVVWRDGGIIGAALPDASDEAMRRSLARRFPEAVEVPPSPPAEAAIMAVVSLLSGQPEDFSSVPVDIRHLPEFERRVLEETRAIPVGQTKTYGEIATALGVPGAARAVGRALGRNPIPILIPCHRILAAAGGGGFSAPGGLTTKIKILEIERARRTDRPELFERLPLAVRPARPGIDPPSRAR